MYLLPTYLEQGMAPDVIDDTNPDDIYLGYFKYNAATDPLHCLIKRITKATINGEVITKIRYPYGRFEWVYSWFERKNIQDWRYRDFPIEYSNINLGYLYNRRAVVDPRGINPAGTRVTSSADWLTILFAADPDGTVLANTASSVLKNPSLDYWSVLTELTTGALEFNARGAGDRSILGEFPGLGYRACFWNTDLYAPGYGQVSEIAYNNDKLSTSSADPYFYRTAEFNYGASVRLIKENSTLSEGAFGTLFGNDGKVYRTKVIGGLEIMIDNLAETLFRTGELIQTVTDNAAWQALITGAKCAYNNDESYV